jgi:4-amino-4-deoxy-L-arabinose transferase-like glycosyltransferase
LQDETGEAGLFRLFNKQLAGQISWLLPLAGLGLVAAAWQINLRWPLHQQHQALLMWGAWLAPQVVFFSYAGLFHRYYLEMLSPAIAALVGAGFVALWNDYRHHRWRGWLLPVALVVSAGVEAFILAQFPGWSRWLTPLVVGLSLIAAIGLIVSRLIRSRAHPAFRLLPPAFCFLSLLIAPTTWASTVLAGRNASLPYAGPELLERPQRSGGNSMPDVSKLVDYLSANRHGEKFLVATLNANSAAPIILATGEPVMALGGFSGSDNILATQELAAKVAQGEVRFFLVPLPPGPPPPGDNPGGGPLPNAPGQQTDTLRWVAEHCTAVSSSLWQSASSAPTPPQPGDGPGNPPPPPNIGPPGQQQLFDCGSAQ